MTLVKRHLLVFAVLGSFSATAHKPLFSRLKKEAPSKESHSQRTSESATCRKDFMRAAFEVLEDNLTNEQEQLSRRQQQRLVFGFGRSTLMRQQQLQVLDVRQVIYGQSPFLEMTVQDKHLQPLKIQVRALPEKDGRAQIELLENGQFVCAVDGPKRSAPVVVAPRLPEVQPAVPSDAAPYKRFELKKVVQGKDLSVGAFKSEAFAADGSGQAKVMGMDLSRPLSNQEGVFGRVSVGAGVLDYGDLSQKKSEVMGVLAAQIDRNVFKKQQPSTTQTRTSYRRLADGSIEATKVVYNRSNGEIVSKRTWIDSKAPKKVSKKLINLFQK